MRMIHFQDSAIPLDKIASVYIDKIPMNTRPVKALDVTGRVHRYAVCDNDLDALNVLARLVSWLEQGAPADVDP